MESLFSTEELLPRLILILKRQNWSVTQRKCNLKVRDRGLFGDDQGEELNVQNLHTTNTGHTDASGSRKKLSFEQGTEDLIQA